MDISSINNINTNFNNTNLNINSTINNGTLSKDISFISTINNDNNTNNKTQVISFPVYQKKTNHISGTSLNKNIDLDNSDKKNKNDINNIQKFDLKNKVFQKQKIEKLNENANNMMFNKLNDKILIENANNLMNENEQNIDIKNKNINNIKIINNDINEEKAITVGDIGNNFSDVESSQKNKSVKDSMNFQSKENSSSNEKENKGFEQLKNMVLEDFKMRINEEKKNDEYSN